MELIDPTTLALARSALDAASLRHAAHAQNIANAHVPGARAVHVSFEEQLDAVRSAIAQGRPLAAGDIPQATAETAAEGAASRIDLDTEVAQLSRNSMHYQALLRALGRQMSLVSLAVSEGKR